MFLEKMYVRCPIDPDEENPRYFGFGQVSAVDNFSEKVNVEFFDTNNVSKYYAIPETREFSFQDISHAKIAIDSIVEYKKKKYLVKASSFNKDEGLYYYYLQNSECDGSILACETEIVASFVDCETSPLSQIKQYEFQNPVWFLGRLVVSKTMQTINNSLYGFKELSGCKISLKPYQLKTVMRCLQENKCRYMIADEVGLGKTIEAISVLKIYIKEKKNQRVLIIVPNSLIEQWKIELAYKFHIFEGDNYPNNNVVITSIENISNNCGHYDFIIVDEVHRVLNSPILYTKLLELSKSVDNILMLSATPIQKRKEEYQKLLTLIQPKKYENMSKEHFDSLLENQSVIVRKVHDALESLDSFSEELACCDGAISDDVSDAFEDVVDCLVDIKNKVNSDTYSEMIVNVSIDSDDHGIEAIQTALSYICENYQLEKSIIRNRRNVLKNDIQNERELLDISYDIQSEFNNNEYQVYRSLSDYIERNSDSDNSIITNYIPLISSFFSSARAFYSELQKTCYKNEYAALNDYVSKWKYDEYEVVKNISSYLDDPEAYESRPVKIIDFIDKNPNYEKVLIFTNYPSTFELYKKLLEKAFPNECCYFSALMGSEERELSVYRFQNDDSYRILLSDESGGEGRNFQNTSILIHIDIPWNANTLEQRIGRLDRIGRKEDSPVTSLVSYAKDTLEEDLFSIWNNGLHIFTRSQSGLEIIMNDIDNTIVENVCRDLKYGLKSIVPEMVKTIEELEKTVKRESYFDLAAYQYQNINQLLEKSISLFEKNETRLFGESMMGWASLSGFNASKQGDDVVRFSASSFSIQSAVNSMFIPPDLELLIGDKINQMQNHIRALNDDKQINADTHYLQGTFNRSLALRNDYIHFFAPGDEIFDSIINNAVRSYKGTSAAMLIHSDEKWSGFIMTFTVVINAAKLYEKGIHTHEIDKFRGFIPAEQFIVAVPTIETSLAEEEIIKRYIGLANMSNSEQKSILHLGSRHPIKGTIYADAFKKSFPQDKWQSLCDRAYKKGLDLAKQKIKSKFSTQLSLLKKELTNEVSAEKATAAFYEREDCSEILKEKNDLIYQIISSPKINLDSICYLRMVNND